jgi:hypothetical protein
MRMTFRQNAVLMAGLAVFFWWTFGFTKQDPMLRTIIPFGKDPYDSVSSFGVIAASLFAMASLVRAFFQQCVG